MNASSGSKFKFKLGGKLPFTLTKPVLIHIQSTHVPFNWNQDTRVKEVENILRFVGVSNNIPLFLLPDINGNFHSMHLKTKVTGTRGGTIEEKEAGEWHLIPHGKEKTITFEVSGEIPKDTKKGDIVLIKITAQYPRMGNRAARSMEFLEVIHITAKMKE
jgi:hypothetical protein